MALRERCADHISYRTLLADLWGIYAPLEAELAAVRWSDYGIDFNQRTKAQWLRADLIALGLSSREVAALPHATQLPPIRNAADGFGVLYVLEGATLGGQIILREIKPNLGLTENAGARFFSSYGADVGERWRGFIAAMSAHGDVARNAVAMERAALATFECFSHWINESATRASQGASHVR